MHIGALTGVACIYGVLHVHRSIEKFARQIPPTNQRASLIGMLRVCAHPALAHCLVVRTARARAALHRADRFAAAAAQEVDAQAARGAAEAM